MLRRVALVLLLAPFGTGIGRQAPPPADLVLRDAKILTVDERFSEARALAVRDGRFVAVGTNEEMRAYVGSTTRVLQGHGRTVIPGLIDTHVHALGVAATEAEQPFRNLRSIAELQEWIRTETDERDFDLAIVCDTGTADRIGAARPAIGAPTVPRELKPRALRRSSQALGAGRT